MATLDSSSTFAEIKAAYADNASYAEDSDAAKARAFVTACRLLILELQSEAGRGSERVRQDENIRRLSDEIDRAQRWIASHATTTSRAAGAARHADFRDFRE